MTAVFGAVVLVGLAGCSVPTTQTSPGPSVTASATPTPTVTVPLVLAVHHSRTPTDVPLSAGEELVRSGAMAWADLGLPGEAMTVVDGQADPGSALQQLMAEPDALALVPVTTVDERIRALTIGGVDPLLDPTTYPLQVEAAEPVESTITTVPVGNFEATLSDNGRPTQGEDSFASDPAVLAGLELAGFDAVFHTWSRSRSAKVLILGSPPSEFLIIRPWAPRCS